MAGIGGMLLPWLRSGGHLILHQPFDMPTFFRQVASHRVSYTVMPPASLNMLLQQEKLLEQVDLSSIRQIGSGSAPLAPWMVKGWQDRGIIVTNFFGSNEGASFLSAYQDFPNPEMRASYFPRFGVDGMQWSGSVAAGLRSRIVNPDTEQVITEAGQPGEMRLAGPTIFSGYFQKDSNQNIANAFDDEGYFKTGDLFEITGDDNRYYRFVDRLKDIIIRGGINISAAEIESLLQGHPDIVESAAVAYADKLMGEKVCIFVVPAEDKQLTLEAITDYMTELKVAKYKLPERLELIEALPRNAVGKVLKQQLREKLKAQ